MRTTQELRTEIATINNQLVQEKQFPTKEGKLNQLDKKLEKTFELLAKSIEKENQDKVESKRNRNNQLIEDAEALLRQGLVSEDSPFEYCYDYNVGALIQIVRKNGFRLPIKKEELLTEIEDTYGFTMNTASNISRRIPKVFIDFNPIKPREYFDDDRMKKVINNFRPTKFMEMKPTAENTLTIEDIEKLLVDKFENINLLLNNLFFKNKKAKFHFLNWLACKLITKKKSKIAYIFQGEPGAGKGIFEEQFLSVIFGNTYCSNAVGNTIFNQFNANIFKDKLLVFVNEIQHDEKNLGKKNYGALKSMITEDMITIEEKGVQPYDIQNHFDMFFFSQHLSIQIEEKDRRYIVVSTGGNIAEMILDMGYSCVPDFFTAIYLELEEFVQALLNLKIDIKEANIAYEDINKQTMIDATETTMNKLVKAIKKNDIERFKTLIIDNEFALESDFTTRLPRIVENIKDNFILNADSHWLYEMISGDDIPQVKFGKYLSSTLRTITFQKKIKGKNYSCKYVDYSKHLEEQENKDKMKKKMPF